QRPYHHLQRGQLFIAKTTRLFRAPACSMNRAAGEPERQRNIVADAFGPHVVKERKALALRIVEAKSDLLALLVQDRQRAILEFRRIARIRLGGSSDDLGAPPPDKTDAEHVRMQRLHENANAPEREARLDQAFAGFRHHMARALPR